MFPWENLFPFPQPLPPGARTAAQVQTKHAAAQAAALEPIPPAQPSYILPPIHFSWDRFMDCNPAPTGRHCKCGQWRVRSLPNSLGGCGHDIYAQQEFACGKTKDPTGKTRRCPTTKGRVFYSAVYVLDLCNTCIHSPQILQIHRDYIARFDPAIFDAEGIGHQQAQKNADEEFERHHQRFWGMVAAYREQGFLQ